MPVCEVAKTETGDSGRRQRWACSPRGRERERLGMRGDEMGWEINNRRGTVSHTTIPYNSGAITVPTG